MSITKEVSKINHFRVAPLVKANQLMPSFRPEFFKILYAENDFSNASVDCGLTFHLFSPETKEIKIDIGAFGIFQINKDRNINEADLYGCLKTLWDEMKQVIEADSNSSLPVQFGETKQLWQFLYDVQRKSQQ
ncbi:MAG: hypothetical protein EOP53_23330 [Sphingobacteriales bacterium]|nr:MAG: hypothetical protein EOP53_23330 [Sphingobacteriales bacterium]